MKLFKNSWCLWQTMWNLSWSKSDGYKSDDWKEISGKRRDGQNPNWDPNQTISTNPDLRACKRTTIDTKSQRQDWNCLDQEVGTDWTLVGVFAWKKGPKKGETSVK